MPGSKNARKAMIVISPFPASAADELHRWLNSPREPNFSDGVPSDLETVTAMLAAKTAAGQTFAATIDEKAIAFIGFAGGWFAGTVVAPEYRGRGLGTEFLRSVVSILRAQGVGELAAYFFADNKAIMKTFVNAGFEVSHAVGAWRFARLAIVGSL